MNLLSNQLYPIECALPNKYFSWIIQNELIKMMAEDVKRRNVSKLRDNIYFGVSADETTDNENNSIFFCNLQNSQ